MALVAKSSGDYEKVPPGLHPAVCVDVHDLGMVDTQWGQKHRIAIIWAVEALGSNGKPLEARKVYGFSLGTKAALRKDLAAWRGKDFTTEQLLGWDVEQVIGAQCQIMVTHVTKGDNTYANVTAIVPASKGQVKLTVPADYVRRKDRAPAPQQAGESRDSIVDDDVPFAWLLPMLLPMTALLGGMIA